ncbi:MAG: hypothetical protein QGI93_15140 [Planctomycetota bacterium]|nr:hypothetical protein [Planctomycetota bacterium]
MTNKRPTLSWFTCVTGALILVLFVGCLGWVLNSVASLISTRLAPYGSQR